MALTISPCKTKKSLREFEQIPERLHKSDPYFVPPFPGSISKLVGPKSPVWRHGEIHPFIAYRDGVPVGRIAATVNRAHNEYYKDKVGFFGFFDCESNTETAKQLFQTAEKVLREKGCESIRGPYSPTSNDECGLLVEGFETAPFVMMPYNPTYYLDLYAEAGLEKVRDLYAFYMSASAAAPEKVVRVAERVKKRTGVTFRNLELKRLDEELKVIQELYNETLNRNWGFVPVTYEELQFAADDLKSIVDPTMVLFAEKEGKPIGFSMVLPNMNEFMRQVKGHKSTLARVLHFIYLLKMKHPKEARLAVLGVKPEYQATGISAVFYYEALMRGKKAYVGGELSWVEESNVEIMRSIELMGGTKYKTYRIFEKGLAV